MGSLYVSASEIELFDLCPRKWAFVYIENKRPPPNDSAALGSRVHAILEKWLKEGAPPNTWTPEGEIAASGLHFLPPPKYPGLVTEERFSFTSRRAWYTGFKDFRYRDANGLIHVGDHKATKSFTWAKTTDEILCHSQALIYSVDEFHKNPNDDRIALDWIYYKTTGSRKAEPRFQIVSRDTVAEMFFEHVDPVAGEITKLHHEVPQDASALDFKPDFRACDAFGGCAFLSICNPTPTQRMQATMTQAGLSLTDKLKAMKAGRAPSPIHPPEAAAPAAPFVPPAALPAQGAVFVPPQAPPAAQFALPFPGAQTASAVAPAPLPPLAAVPAYVPPPAPQVMPTEAAIAQAQVAPTAPGTVVGFTVTPTAPVEAPKKRGRPKKSAVEAAEPEAEPATPAGFTLYVGCAPIGCDVVSCLDYVNAAHDLLKEATGISHYREIEYGKGPGELCKALESAMEQLGGPTGDVVYGNTQIEQDVASVWFSKAAKVVRAFR